MRTFWDRDKVFKNIGFEKFVSEESFVNPEKRRGYISDLETSKMIIKQYQDNKKTGKPFFDFTVTMQNHFSWGEDDYPEDYRVKLETPGLSQDRKAILTSYATGVRDADTALKYLLDYFSSVSEPTIIVFYGDHMPALDEDTLTAGGYIQGNSSDPQNVQKLHSTPYIIWNNYSQKKVRQVNLSMYELVPYMTQSFNLQRPLYFDYLLDQFNTYHGYASGAYIGGDNVATLTMPADAKKYSDTQWLFEYDLLIGKRYANVLTQ